MRNLSPEQGWRAGWQMEAKEASRGWGICWRCRGRGRRTEGTGRLGCRLQDALWMTRFRLWTWKLPWAGVKLVRAEWLPSRCQECLSEKRNPGTYPSWERKSYTAALCLHLLPMKGQIVISWIKPTNSCYHFKHLGFVFLLFAKEVTMGKYVCISVSLWKPSSCWVSLTKCILSCNQFRIEKKKLLESTSLFPAPLL